MPKRVSAKVVKARPKASQFKVGTKRTFGGKSFVVQTRKTTSGRTKYWASTLGKTGKKSRLKPKKRVLRGAGETELLKALQQLAKLESDVMKSCLRACEDKAYVTELRDCAAQMIHQIVNYGCEEAVKAQRIQAAAAKEDPDYQDSVLDVVNTTLDAVITFNMVDRTKYPADKFTYLHGPNGTGAWVYANDADNMYVAARAESAWPFKRLVGHVRNESEVIRQNSTVADAHLANGDVVAEM